MFNIIEDNRGAKAILIESPQITENTITSNLGNIDVQQGHLMQIMKDSFDGAQIIDSGSPILVSTSQGNPQPSGVTSLSDPQIIQVGEPQVVSVTDPKLNQHTSLPVTSISEPQVVGVSLPQFVSISNPQVIGSNPVAGENNLNLNNQILVTDNAQQVSPDSSVFGSTFVSSSQGSPDQPQVISVSDPQLVGVSNPVSIGVSQPQNIGVPLPVLSSNSLSGNDGKRTRSIIQAQNNQDSAFVIPGHLTGFSTETFNGLPLNSRFQQNQNPQLNTNNNEQASFNSFQENNGFLPSQFEQTLQQITFGPDSNVGPLIGGGSSPQVKTPDMSALPLDNPAIKSLKPSEFPPNSGSQQINTAKWVYMKM